MPAVDWLSRLFEMVTVRGRLDLRCAYGAPWRIDQGPGEANEIPYHAVISGSGGFGGPARGGAGAAEAGRHPAAAGKSAACDARRWRRAAKAGARPAAPQSRDQRKCRHG